MLAVFRKMLKASEMLLIEDLDQISTHQTHESSQFSLCRFCCSAEQMDDVVHLEIAVTLDFDQVVPKTLDSPLVSISHDDSTNALLVASLIDRSRNFFAGQGAFSFRLCDKSRDVLV